MMGVDWWCGDEPFLYSQEERSTPQEEAPKVIGNSPAKEADGDAGSLSIILSLDVSLPTEKIVRPQPSEAPPKAPRKATRVVVRQVQDLVVQVYQTGLNNLQVIQNAPADGEGGDEEEVLQLHTGVFAGAFLDLDDGKVAAIVAEMSTDTKSPTQAESSHLLYRGGPSVTPDPSERAGPV